MSRRRIESEILVEWICSVGNYRPVSNAPQQIPIAKLQEVQRIVGTVAVEVEGRIVGRNAKEGATEGEKVGRVNVAVAVGVTEEAVKTERVIVAAKAVVVSVQRPSPSDLTGQHAELIITVNQRTKLRQRPRERQ